MAGTTKDMYPEGTTASLSGFHGLNGELLVGIEFTQAEVDEWNGVKPKKKKSEAASYSNRSSKDDLEEYGRTVGIELDKRKTKKSLLRQLKEFVKK